MRVLRGRLKASSQETKFSCVISGLYVRAARPNPTFMPIRNEVHDTFTLSGDHEHRVEQLLEFARHAARVAQSGAAPRMQDALVELEDALADHLAALSNAAEEDKEDAEASGEAERGRQAWRPLRAA
jgi:hypothetical protein